MEIQRLKEGIIITETSKISKKKVHNKNGIGYQYFTRLPKTLFNFFNFNTLDTTTGNPVNQISFFTEDHSYYVYDRDTLEKVGSSATSVKSWSSKINVLKNKKGYVQGYQYTLPLRLFKEVLDPEENQYIKYTLDTTQEDLLGYKGVVTIEIVAEEEIIADN